MEFGTSFSKLEIMQTAITYSTKKLLFPEGLTQITESITLIAANRLSIPFPSVDFAIND